MVLQVEDVQELAASLDVLPGERDAEFIVFDSSTGQSRVIPPSELPALGPHDRARMTLTKQLIVDGYANPMINVSFYRGQTPTVSGPPAAQEVALKHLLERGRPRVNWYIVAGALPLVVVFGLAGLWVWVALTAHLTVAGQVLGAAVTLVVVAGGLRRYRARDTSTTRAPGHLIPLESRARTAERRADGRRDLRVILLSSPVTLLAGFLLSALTNAFGLTD